MHIVCADVGCAKPVEYVEVFHPILVVDEDVIQIHYYKIIGERSYDIIHHSHKSCWSICQNKGHDQPFKKTFF
jgi:hypothetical protein